MIISIDAELILYTGLGLAFKRTDASTMVSYKPDHFVRNLNTVEICQTRDLSQGCKDPSIYTNQSM